MSRPLEYNATLVSRVDLEPGLAIFRVRPDRVVRPPPWFVPGQYVTIGMNRRGGRGEALDEDAYEEIPVSVRRPMTIASAPEEGDVAEFYIRRVDQPESPLPLTHVLWPIRVGDRLQMRPIAVGKFTLADTVGEAPVLKVMVAAGTGLAPFLSMVRSRVLRDPSARLDDIAVLHGASLPSGLGYREELEALAERHGLRYLPTVSRPKEAPTWTGATGRVEHHFTPETIAETERALGLGEGTIRPATARVLVCGLQGTVARTVTSLLARGFVPNHRRIREALEIAPDVPAAVFWEQYDYAPILDVGDVALMDGLRAIYKEGSADGSR